MRAVWHRAGARRPRFPAFEAHSAEPRRRRSRPRCPAKGAVSRRPSPSREARVSGAPGGPSAYWSLAHVAPKLAAQRRGWRPSGGRGAHLTLVNLTSRLRIGRGRAGGFLSGCPFSTAPLVVAMAPPRSLARGALVCGAPARPGHCAACSRGDSSPPLYAAPHASLPRGPSNWLQDRRKGGRAAGGRRGKGRGARPLHPTPPAAPAGARVPAALPACCGPSRLPRRALSRPGGWLWTSSPKRRWAPEVAGLGHPTRQGAEPQGPQRPAASPKPGGLFPRHLQPPPSRRTERSPNFGRLAALRNARSPLGPAQRRSRGSWRGCPASLRTCPGLGSSGPIPARRTDTRCAPPCPSGDRRLAHPGPAGLEFPCGPGASHAVGQKAKAKRWTIPALRCGALAPLGL